MWRIYSVPCAFLHPNLSICQTKSQKNSSKVSGLQKRHFDVPLRKLVLDQQIEPLPPPERGASLMLILIDPFFQTR